MLLNCTPNLISQNSTSETDVYNIATIGDLSKIADPDGDFSKNRHQEWRFFYRRRYRNPGFTLQNGIPQSSQCRLCKGSIVAHTLDAFQLYFRKFAKI